VSDLDAHVVPEGHVLDRGRGPAVLMLHGTAPGATADANFGSLLPGLDGYRLLAPDLLGFGGSPNSLDLDLGPALWVRQAWQVLDSRDIDEVIVLGNSMGARIALEMAIAVPPRIRGLVLLSTRIRPSATAAQKLLRDYAPSPAAMETLLRECFVSDEELITSELVGRRYEETARPGAHDAMQAAFAGIAAAGPGPADGDITRLAQPTLLLHGREDRVVPAENGVQLAQLLPHADLHLLGGTGHWLQIERSDTVLALVRGFLDRHAAPRATRDGDRR
jgi:pimeloyl-ACP methyl ester carboxylesterase